MCVSELDVDRNGNRRNQVGDGGMRGEYGARPLEKEVHLGRDVES